MFDWKHAMSMKHLLTLNVVEDVDEKGHPTLSYATHKKSHLKIV